MDADAFEFMRDFLSQQICEPKGGIENHLDAFLNNFARCLLTAHVVRRRLQPICLVHDVYVPTFSSLVFSSFLFSCKSDAALLALLEPH